MNDSWSRRGATSPFVWLAVAAVLLAVVMGFGYWRKTVERQRLAAQAAANTPAPSAAPQAPATPQAAAAARPAAPSPASASATPAPDEKKKGKKAEAEGPKQSLHMQLVWEISSEPVPGTTATLALTQPSLVEDRIAQRTDDLGRTAFEIDAGQKAVWLRGDHPKAQMVAKKVDLPTSETVIVALKLGAEIYGHVYIEGENRPAAGADVRLFPGGKTTTAGPDGAFELAGIGKKSTTQIVATLGNLRSFMKESEVAEYPVAPDTRIGPIDLFLKPGLTLRGRVLDKTTRGPIAGATLKAADPAFPKEKEAVSDALGAYTLEGLGADPVRVLAAAQGYASEREEVSLADNSAPTRDFLLEPGGVVDVLVTNKSGAPVAEASVGVSGMSFGRSQKSGADGRARLEGVSLVDPPDIYASAKNSMYGTSKKPEFALGQTRTDLTLVVREADESEGKGGVFAGHVMNKDGAPIAGATVKWGLYYNSGRNRDDTTSTDGEGRYRLAVQGSGESGYQLSAWGDGWAPESKTDIQPGTEEAPAKVDFQLEAGHWVAVQVVDESDAPIKQVSVSFQNRRDPMYGYREFPNQPRNLKTDEEGRCRVENLPGPEVHVELYARDKSRLEKPVPVDKETKLVMKAMGTIRGLVVDDQTVQPVPDFTVRVRGNYIDSDLYQKGRVFSAPDGRFSLKDIDQDIEYDVTVQAEGYGPETQEKITAAALDQAEEKVFRLKSGGQLKGVLVDAAMGAPIAGAPVIHMVMSEQYQNMWVQWTRLDDVYGAESRQRAVTDELGGFTFNEGEKKGSLFIKAPNYERLAVRPEDRTKYADASGALRIPLQLGASVTGVYIRNNQPQSGEQVYLNQQETRAGADYGSVTTDAAGQYSWSSLGAGKYSLAWFKRFGNTATSALTRTFELAAGEQKTVNLGEGLGPYALYGRVLDADAAVAGALIRLDPRFTWDYSNFGDYSAADGNYRIEGLQAGAYSASLQRETRNWQQPRTETIEIKGDTQHDFVLSPSHKVVARFVFPPEVPEKMRAKFTNATLSTTNRQAGSGDNPDQLTQYGNARMADGSVRFDGRFKGEYRISLQYQESQRNSSSVAIPQTFQLDNLNGDQDLGDIPVPSMGSVRFQIAFDPQPQKLPEYLVAALLLNGDPKGATSLQIKPDQPDQVVGPVPLGVYDVLLNAQAYKTEPQKVQVTVGPDEPPVVSFLLRPEGIIYGLAVMRQGPVNNPADMGLLKRVTLSGNGINRVLTPVPYSQMDESRYMTGGDFAVGPSFVFRDLPAGTYDLVIEADGYETWRGQRTVVPGVTDRNEQQIPMKKLP
ncbi:MAG: carboxypeptidase-like regulatory domain-containing protein [Candidatus Sumerlaeota bacterium]|nr:carboxypeptidase-like regulatory domain-containing protein [Candidatus Sumerlaeota bacterium]